MLHGARKLRPSTAEQIREVYTMQDMQAMPRLSRDSACVDCEHKLECIMASEPVEPFVPIGYDLVACNCFHKRVRMHIEDTIKRRYKITTATTFSYYFSLLKSTADSRLVCRVHFDFSRPNTYSTNMNALYRDALPDLAEAEKFYEDHITFGYDSPRFLVVV